MSDKTVGPKRQIGSTSLSLPPLGLGAAHFGGLYHRVSGEVAHATMQAAWTGGIRYFDTAPFYGRGLSEHRTGDFLIDQKRSDFVITTKVGRVLHRAADPKTFDRTPWGGGLNFEIEFTYSYDGVMRSYEQSLIRLGLDTVDALLIHDPETALDDPELHASRMKDLVEGGIKALEQLKRSGDIKAIGMGLNAAESLDTIAPLVDLDFAIVAMPYTLLDQSALQTGLKRCIDKNISVVIGAPYASGILATGPGPTARYRYGIAPNDIQDKVRRIEAVCRTHGVSLQAAALQFPLAHPAVVSVIPGAAQPIEVEKNIGFMQEPIPVGLWDDLKADGLIAADAPMPG
jgi:D-threo-aldose 1-dehydrogenase